MIVAKLKSGARADLDLEGVSQIVVEGFSSVRGTDVEVSGQPARGLVMTCAETGVEVVVLWPLEQAQELGRNLASGRIIPATAEDLRRLGG